MGARPENMPKGFEPKNFDPENMPEGMTPPEMPENFDAENMRPQGGRPGGRGDRNDCVQMEDVEVSKDFTITAGGSYFYSVEAAK